MSEIGEEIQNFGQIRQSIKKHKSNKIILFVSNFFLTAAKCFEV